jgi:hypothetical protein
MQIVYESVPVKGLDVRFEWNQCIFHQLNCYCNCIAEQAGCWLYIITYLCVDVT